jgi:ectoine hydroxylase-related dioxygenase (phytanoyl-CoA dioxygenase family)
MLRRLIADQGFAVAPGVFALNDVEDVVAELNRVALPRSRAGLRHALRHPAIAGLAKNARLLGIAQEVLGPQAFPFRATLFDKSPKSNWLVVWHQDTALPLRERRETPGWGPWSVKEGVIYAHAPASSLCDVLVLRVHLDDSTEQNGPLRVLPGSHKAGVLTDDAIHELVARVPAVDCAIAKGGVLAMRPLLVHSSSKSRCEASRRVIHIEYSASATVANGLDLAIT